MTKQTTILGKLESFTEMLAESAAFLTPAFPGSEDKFYGIGVSKASPIFDIPSEEFYVVNVWSINGEIVFTALFFDENHVVVDGNEVSQDEALAIANEKMGGFVGNILDDPTKSIPVAVVAAIIEMPTFINSKIEGAPEGNDGMFRVSFDKKENLTVDCYDNVLEQKAYEIRLYEVLGGETLLTIEVENGVCYLDGEEVGISDISVQSIVAMLTFIHGEGDYYDGACEEYALSSMDIVSSEFGELIQESIEVYKRIDSDELSPDEKVKLFERHFELEERRKELREKL